MWPSHSKWLSIPVESASNFVLSLKFPPWELFGLLRRTQLWATGDWHLHHHKVPAHASRLMQSIFGETSNHPGDSAPLEPRFGDLQLLTFPKTKITFEGEKFHTVDETQENLARQLMAIGKSVWGPKVPTLKKNWGVIVRCTMFLVPCVFNKCLYFSYYMAGYLLDRLYLGVKLMSHGVLQPIGPCSRKFQAISTSLPQAPWPSPHCPTLPLLTVHMPLAPSSQY